MSEHASVQIPDFSLPRNVVATRSSRSPQLRLALEDKTGTGKVASTSVVWNPSNVLRGCLTITCESSFDISEAAIFLEGISRNWVSDVAGDGSSIRISTAERKFLSQTMDVSPLMLEPTTTVPEGFRLNIPFHFFISTTIANSSPGSPLHCLKLPPSIELGGVYIDESTGKRFAQPCISYQVRAVVRLVEQRQDQPRSAETSTPVVIIPHTEELPPTDTKDFPAEFKLLESRPIRGSWLGRSLGTMTVSMQEPQALTYSAPSIGASTVGFLEFTVESTDISTSKSLQVISFKVLSSIRVKTFYSVKAFPGLPSQSLLAVHGGTRLRDEIIKLKTQHISSVPWGYTYDISEQTLTSGPTESGEESIGNLPAQLDRHLPQYASASDQQPLRGKWTAKISHPIGVDFRLLPTFYSSIVARLYSVILRVKVSGIRRESFDLEVPLQVVHNSPETQSSETTQDFGAATGLVGADSTSLEFRSASASSWFSDESLERENLPPRYHP